MNKKTESGNGNDLEFISYKVQKQYFLNCFLNLRDKYLKIFE